MRRLVAICIFLLCQTFVANAFHIVGGDFSYRHISGDTYELKLKMYRDCGGGGATFDQQINVKIFDKETNAQKSSLNVPMTDTYHITFNTFCINPQLRCVETAIYTKTFNMPSGSFNNVSGYYVSWERCCRNSIIKNIITPDDVGMAFYMEFPSPYPGGGDFFYNNSPEYTRDPLNYLCVGEPFLYDFKCVDVDGDELRYSLITPLNGGHTNGGNPGGRSVAGPYDDATWFPGYGTGNMMDGNPDLRVNSDKAIIYIVPQQIGVYVISVLCEEFRAGIKIGEIRRELQLEVITCPPRFKPIEITSLATDTLDLVIGQSNCFDIHATDLSVGEILKLRIDTGGMQHAFSQGATLNPPNVSGVNSITTQFCWTPTCPVDTGTGQYIDFIAYDNSCPFSQEDTVRVYFRIINPANRTPAIQTNKIGNILTINHEESGCIHITGTDGDPADLITMIAQPRGDDVFAFGATLDKVIAVGNGTVTYDLCWTPPCIGLPNDSFYVDFIINDNACPEPAVTTKSVLIVVPPLQNQKPEITATPIIHLVMDQENIFYVTGQDLDLEDNIEIEFAPINYNPLSHGGKFQSVQIFSGGETFIFTWTPSCADFQGGAEIFVDFLIRDHKCSNEKFDTIRVQLILEDKPNKLPIFYEPFDTVFTIAAGYTYEVPVAAFDLDEADHIYFSAASNLFGSEPNIRADFPNRDADDSVRSTITIFPDCNLNSSNIYAMHVYAVNQKCISNDTTEKIINFIVEPLLPGSDPIVPNAFTPNGDGINDVLKASLTKQTICPDDFEISIYDRWGQKLFHSKNPDFEWDGGRKITGAYVYVIKIGNKNYSGFIALVK